MVRSLKDNEHCKNLSDYPHNPNKCHPIEDICSDCADNLIKISCRILTCPIRAKNAHESKGEIDFFNLFCDQLTFELMLKWKNDEVRGDNFSISKLDLEIFASLELAMA